MRQSVLIIVPAFNEAGAIIKTLEAIQAVIQQLPQYRFELLVVDDHSQDATAYIAKKQGLPVASLPINLGIGGAVQTGYQYALTNHFDIAIQMDGDGQHDPKDIPTLLNVLEKEKADIVVGSRFVDGLGHYKPPVARKLGMLFSEWLLKTGTGYFVRDTTSGFRAMNRRTIRLFALDYPKMFAGIIPLAMLAKRKAKIVEVAAHFHYRQTGKSSIHLFKSIYYPFKVMLAVFGILIMKNELYSKEVFHCPTEEGE